MMLGGFQADVTLLYLPRRPTLPIQSALFPSLVPVAYGKVEGCWWTGKAGWQARFLHMIPALLRKASGSGR